MKVELKIEKGPMKGKIFTFIEHDTFVFGRSPNTSCPLPDDDYISRNHFILEVNPPNVYIRDLGSLNGTIVNGKKIGGRNLYDQRASDGERFSVLVNKNNWNRDAFEQELMHGDSVETGDTVFRINIIRDAKCYKCGKIIDSKIMHLYKIGDKYLCRECRELERLERERKIKAQQQRKPIINQNIKKTENKPNLYVKKQENKPIIRDFQQEKKAADFIMKLLQNVVLKGQAQVLPAFPGYEVKRKLGEGGMGAVFEAIEKKKGRKVAIKIIRPEQNAKDNDIKRFRDREMKISMNMKHDNIVSYIEGDFSDGIYYLVMEMVEGSDVQRLIDTYRRIDVKSAVSIIIDSLKGLEYIHKHKVVHRDIKPPNILLKKTDKGWIPKIADFGLSKNLKSSNSITKRGEVAGSIPFMPPDQLLNFKGVSFAADIFSMGATLYYMLTGRYSRNFPKNKDPLLAVLQEKNIPIKQAMPNIPLKLADVIDKSLAELPEKRFKNAKEFRKSLEKAIRN